MWLRAPKSPQTSWGLNGENEDSCFLDCLGGPCETLTDCLAHRWYEDFGGRGVSSLVRPCDLLFLTCPVTIAAMRIFFLVLLVVEVSTTMMGGVWAMVAPMDFVPNMTGLVPGAAAPELSRLLGAMWIVVALILACVPFLRDVRAMRCVLVPLLAGDVLHVAALIASDALSPSQVILPVVFFAYRGAAVWQPRWLQA